VSVDLLIRAGRAITPSGEAAVDVGVRGGRIVAVDPYGAGGEGAELLELGADEVLLPGLVDTHVHVNDPGRTEWEGFATATAAAAAGGVTTIVDMPLNSIPPTCDVESLAVKRRTAAGQCAVDVGFWGGAIPGNADQLRAMYDAGVFGFKCFLLHSGVDEFPPLSDEELHEALAEAKTFDGLVIVHAEDAHTIDSAPPAEGRGYAGFLGSRPRQAEELAITQVVDAARQTGARAHILHLSDADALPLIRDAVADGVRLSVETCPHYLTLDAEDIPDGATQFKCCPPIREHANRDRLWEGLADGTIATVVTDHSPSTADLKLLDVGDFGQAWGGIAGLQVGLPAIWTEARERGFTLAHVVRWMGTNTADQVGLSDRGRIAEGAVADFVVFAPDESFTVDVAALHHKNPVCAYAGRTLTGTVRQTWLAGVPIDIDDAPRGRLLRREP
jgi:allantoinase